jgi:hypothetical protein
MSTNQLPKNDALPTLETSDQLEKYFGFWSQQIDNIISIEKKRTAIANLQNLIVGVIISSSIIIFIIFLIGKLGNLTLEQILDRSIFSNPSLHFSGGTTGGGSPGGGGNPAGNTGAGEFGTGQLDEPNLIISQVGPVFSGTTGGSPGPGGGIGTYDESSIRRLLLLLRDVIVNLKVYQFLFFPFLGSILISRRIMKLKKETVLAIIKSKKEMIDAEKDLGLMQIKNSGSYKPFSYFPMPDIDGLLAHKQTLTFTEASVSFTVMLSILGSISSVISLIFVLAPK